jgi:hypothetical protein
MWPTDKSLLLLLFGLLPLAYVGVSVARRGIGELMSLGCVGTVSLWLGYHFSPWLFYYSGVWTSSILVEEFIDDALLFSALCMIAFLIGYTGAMHKWQGMGRRFQGEMIRFASIRKGWLVSLVLITVIMFLVRTHGFAEAWKSSVPRGSEDWIPLDTLGRRLAHAMRVLYPVAALFLSCTASLYVLQSPPRERLQRYCFCVFCLIIASLETIWSFSRDAGSPFLILAFILLKIKGRRAILGAVLCLLAVIWLGTTGLRCRQDHNPGLGNFLAVVVGGNGQEVVNTTEKPLLTANANPLSATEAWTLKASLTASDRAEGWGDARCVLWNLHPLPSVILPVGQIGPDLTEVMDTVGVSGVTTPALGEIFYAFDHCGILLMIPLGGLYGWFESLSRRKPTVITFACLVLCFASFPLGLHNGVRAMSRLPLYALLIYAASCKLTTQKQRAAPLRQPRQGRSTPGQPAAHRSRFRKRTAHLGNRQTFT